MLRTGCSFVAVLTLAVVAACHGGADLGATSHALTTGDVDRVLGFESTSVSDWSIVQSGPGTLAVSSSASQGTRSLAVNSHGYVPVQSVALNTLGTRVGGVIKYDILSPEGLRQLSPHWYGLSRLYIEIPSLGLFNTFVGQAELTSMTLGQWNTVTLTPSADVLNKLRGSYSDLRVTIVVNAPTNNASPYLIDNLRFSEDGPGPGGSAATVIALPFPNGVSRDSVAVAANGSLRLNDRTKVKQPDDSWAAVSNAGDSETNIGVDAAAGAVASLASVTLRERAQIAGDLKTGGTLTRQSGASVSGAIVEHASLTPTTAFSWAVQLPSSNSGDVAIPSDASRDLDPGSYGQILVNSRARLSLKAGVYFVASLDIESEAQLVLAKSEGPIIVYVTGPVAFKGTVVDNGGAEGDFLLVSLGPTEVFIEQAFTGTIVAPNAKLTLASCASGHRGTFFAKDIEIHQDNTIVAMPFGWTRLFGGQSKPVSLPADPANPPRIPSGPFGTKLTPAAAPRVTPLTAYSGGTELGVGASGAGSPVPAPRPLGITSPGYVDNITWGYVHEAFDYVTPTGAFAAERPGRLVGLTLRRYFKPRFAGIPSSFGVGMFSNFDSKLRIVGNSTSGYRVFSFQTENDLGEVQWIETDTDTGDSQIDGIFHNTAGLGPSLKLLAVNGSPTPDATLATTAVLTDWNGNQQIFEIIDTVPNERAARLQQLVDANGNAVTLSYKYPAGAGREEPSKLWQIAWVADNYGLAGTFDYAASTVNGRWVVSAFHAPNGSTITYTYDASQVVDGLVGPALKTVVEPDGAVSTFSTGIESATNLVIVHINDRASVPGLMVKDVYLSQSQMRTASGSYVAQQRNLLRQIVNGAGEVAYANWDNGSQPGVTYIYEGGGTLLRIELRNGNTPVSFARANFYDPTLPPSHAVFDPVETYQTDGRGRIKSKTDAAGRLTSWVRDVVSGVVKAVHMSDGSIQSRSYDLLSRLTNLVDRNGVLSWYSYDLKGNLQKAIEAVGQLESAATSFQVNSRGQTTRAT